ncbi:MAG: hypothetical protein L6408_06720, partial [Nanoarchaeota archaeon]|nr:hypothetical protein [Nanoarchaeota archaeon]
EEYATAQKKYLENGKVWIVDPLDGTKEFSKGLDEYAISVALIEDGQPVIGIVYAPARDKLLFAEKAIDIIQSRYDSQEYKYGIESIKDPAQKIYGAIDKLHTSAVLDWVKKLWSGETPEALKIVAAGHDWDRAFEDERDRLEDYPHENGKPVKEWYNIHKAMHSANTARILRRELSDVVPEDMMLDIVYMELNHELGGKKTLDGDIIELMDKATNSYNLNEAVDVLTKADTLAFFNVLDIYVDWRKPEKVEQKIRFMYDRIDDEKVKGIIKNLKFENPKAINIFNKIIK